MINLMKKNSNCIKAVFSFLMALVLLTGNMSETYAWFSSYGKVEVKGTIGVWSNPTVNVKFYDSNNDIDESVDDIVMKIKITKITPSSDLVSYEDTQGGGIQTFSFETVLTHTLDMKIVKGEGGLVFDCLPPGEYIYEQIYPDDTYQTEYSVANFYILDNGPLAISYVEEKFEGTGVFIDGIDYDNEETFLQKVEFDNYKGETPPIHDDASISGTVRENLDADLQHGLQVPLEGILVSLVVVNNGSETTVSTTHTDVDGRYWFPVVPPGDYTVKFTVDQLKNSGEPYEFIKYYYSLTSDVETVDVDDVNDKLIGIAHTTVVENKESIVDAALKVKFKVDVHYFQNDVEIVDEAVLNNYVDYDTRFDPVYKQQTDPGWAGFWLHPEMSDNPNGIIHVIDNGTINLRYYDDADVDYNGKFLLEYIDIEKNARVVTYVYEPIDWTDINNKPEPPLDGTYMPEPDGEDDGEGFITYTYTITQEDLDRLEDSYSFADKITDYYGGDLNSTRIYALNRPEEDAHNVVRIYVKMNMSEVTLNHFKDGTVEPVTHKNGLPIPAFVYTVPVGDTYDGAPKQADELLHIKWVFSHREPEPPCVVIAKSKDDNTINFFYNLEQRKVIVEYYDVTGHMDDFDAGILMPSYGYDEMVDVGESYTALDDRDPQGKWRLADEESARTITVSFDEEENVIKLHFIKLADVTIRYLIVNSTTAVTDQTGARIQPKIIENLDVGSECPRADDPTNLNRIWEFVSAVPGRTIIVTDGDANRIDLFYRETTTPRTDSPWLPPITGDGRYTPSASTAPSTVSGSTTNAGTEIADEDTPLGQTDVTDEGTDGEIEEPPVIIDSDETPAGTPETAKTNPKTSATDSYNTIFIVIASLLLTVIYGLKKRKQNQ